MKPWYWERGPRTRDARDPPFPAAVLHGFIDNPLGSIRHIFQTRGVIALDNIENILSLFCHLCLFNLPDFQPAEYLVVIIAIAVFMRTDRRRFTLADRHKSLAAVRKAQRHIAVNPVNVMGAQSQL